MLTIRLLHVGGAGVGGGEVGNFLLMETGDFLLLETGDKFVLDL